jgi:hypothetical protein
MPSWNSAAPPFAASSPASRKRWAIASASFASTTIS